MILMIRVIAAAAVLGLSGWGAATVWGWKVDRDLFMAEKASLQRSVAALTLERDQAREARAVADAWRARDAKAASDMREIKEAIAKGKDDEIPDWYLDHLRDLGVVRAEPAAD